MQIFCNNGITYSISVSKDNYIRINMREKLPCLEVYKAVASFVKEEPLQVEYPPYPYRITEVEYKRDNKSDKDYLIEVWKSRPIKQYVYSLHNEKIYMVYAKYQEFCNVMIALGVLKESNGIYVPATDDINNLKILEPIDPIDEDGPAMANQPPKRIVKRII